ncbi:hypothetical protein, partial [Sphingosinicella sp.]|uniref:hypothetical protein n=1 Tax=Sphingosinicella sp. TaxID=1917971 RepID=UPI0040378F87
DSDTGVGADPPGRGRGGGPRPGATGVTDRDPTDPVGRGRGGTGVTDRDAGTNADPVGRGRGGTGVTDSDTGANADPVGRGRGAGAPGSLTDEQRRRRCQEENEALGELILQSQRPEGWSDERLAEMRSALGEINATIARLESDYGTQLQGLGWRHPAAVAARNQMRYLIRGSGVSRDATPPEMSFQIAEQIRRAEAASARRAELHRQMAMRRTNLLTFECDRYR